MMDHTVLQNRLKTLLLLKEVFIIIHQPKSDAMLRSLTFKEQQMETNIQLLQELLPQNHFTRCPYANRMIWLTYDNSNVHKKIIIKDETHFHLNGYANTRNSCLWGIRNPQIIH